MAPNLEFVARIDSRPATAELGKLRKQGARVASAMSQGVQRAVSAGMRATGMDQFSPGNLISAGVNSIRNNGLQDIINESQQYAGNVVSELFTGDFDEKSRAAAAARNDVLATFQYEIGRLGPNGEMPQHILDFYGDRVSHHEILEQGREKVLTDKRFFGPNIADLGQELFSKITGAIESGFNSIRQALTS